MKALKLDCITLITLLLFIGSFHLHAQQEIDVTKKDNKIIIIKKYTDKDGVKTIEKIVKEGDEVIDLHDEFMHIEGLENIHEHLNHLDVDVIHDKDIRIEFNKDGEHNVFEWRGDGEIPDEVKQRLREKDIHFDFDHDGDRNYFFIHKDENKAFLGVVMGHTEEEGVVIERVVENTGAEASGLQAGDIMTAVNENAINRSGDLTKELRKFKPDDEITINYIRDGQEASTNATLGVRKNTWTSRSPRSYRHRHPCKPFIGVYLNTGYNKNGVKITDVIDNTPAYEVGMEAGDVITAIDGVPVKSHHETLRERDKHKAGDFFTLTFTRDGLSQEVEAQFPACEEPKEEKVEKDIPKEEPVEEPANTNKSPTVNRVNLPANTLELQNMSAYPNPTSGKINVEFKAEAAPVVIQITDISGREILRDEIADFNGFYQKELNLKDATPGTLLLSITQNDQVYTEQIVLTGAY